MPIMIFKINFINPLLRNWWDIHMVQTMGAYGGREPLEVLLNECVVKLDY